MKFVATKWINRLAGCLFSMLAASAAWPALFERDKDPDETPWAESEFTLPAFPDPANLIPFEVGFRTGKKFSIDGQSLSVGKDGVIRFTLSIVSAEGAKNISYEGMRCATGERRPYAFGRPDGTWSRARGDRWIAIRGDRNNHYVELFVNYFCSVHAPNITTPEAARQILRKGGVDGR